MAWTMSAAPKGGLHQFSGLLGATLAGRLKNEGIAALPLATWARIAGLSHVLLLGAAGALQFGIGTAQAAAGPAVNDTHLGLLVLTGTASALLTLAAGQASPERQHSRDMKPAAAAYLPSAPEAQDQQVWAELAARASHELRTPLNAVIGFSDVMERELLGPIGNQRYREYISHIRESGFALLKSSEDTLAMTSLVADRANRNASEVDVSGALREAWREASHDATRRGITLSVDDKIEVQITAQRSALKQTLVNLFAEAIRVTPPKGQIKAAVALRDGTLELTISCDAAIAAEPSAHRHGAAQDCPTKSGLSLAVACALMELQGGSLHLQQVAGHWRVTARLPASAPRL